MKFIQQCTGCVHFSECVLCLNFFKCQSQSTPKAIILYPRAQSNLFCKELDSKHFRLFEAHIVSTGDFFIVFLLLSFTHKKNVKAILNLKSVEKQDMDSI